MAFTISQGHNTGDTPRRTAVETSIAEIFVDILGCAQVGVTDSFFDLGGRSLATMALLARIDEQYGVRVPLASLIEAPTPEHLAALVCSAETLPSGPLVPFRRSGSKPPLFCVHGANGSALPFRELAKSVGLDQPFYGLQANSIEDGSIPYIRIEDMAKHYIQQIRKVQPTGPFNIVGWSSGGMLAFEIAHQLHAAKETVGLLALLDCEAPISIFQLRGLSTCAKTHFDRLLAYNLPKKLTYVADVVSRRMQILAFCVKYKFRTKIARRVPRISCDVDQAQAVAEQRYLAKPYAGDAVLFRTASVAARYPQDLTLGWGKLIAGGVDVRDIPGDHYSIMTQPHVRALAEHLRSGVRVLLSFTLLLAYAGL